LRPLGHRFRKACFANAALSDEENGASGTFAGFIEGFGELIELGVATYEGRFIRPWHPGLMYGRQF
jgi:hypothetical protein